MSYGRSNGSWYTGASSKGQHNRYRRNWACGLCKEANWASNWRCGNCRVEKGKCFAKDVESDKRGASPTTSLAEMRAQNKKLAEQVKKLEDKSAKDTNPVAKEVPQDIKNINEEIRDIDKKKGAPGSGCLNPR